MGRHGDDEVDRPLFAHREKELVLSRLVSNGRRVDSNLSAPQSQGAGRKIVANGRSKQSTVTFEPGSGRLMLWRFERGAKRRGCVIHFSFCLQCRILPMLFEKCLSVSAK